MLTKESPARQRNAMLGVLLAGAFLMLLTETFFNNALPTIIKQYAVGQATAQWVSTGYQLVAGLMIPLSAWLFHNFNLKHSYLVLVTIFLVGCLAGFFAPNFAVLLAARLIQAISAGSMIPLIQNVVLVLYPTEKRGTIMGLIGLVVAFGPALGPTLGGLIIDTLGLRWLFGLLIPLTVILLFATFSLVQPIEQQAATSVDWPSIVGSSLGFGALLFGFSEIGNASRVTTTSLIALLLGIVILIWFCRRQMQLANPLIELRVFTNGTFNLATTLSALSNIALLGVELVLPLYLQRVHGLSALTSGKLFDRFGIRPVALGGFAIISSAPCQCFSLLPTPAWW